MQWFLCFGLNASDLYYYLNSSLAVADPGFSPGGGAPTPKIAIIFHIFAENCMKMKEFGPPGGARVPGAPPWIRQ